MNKKDQYTAAIREIEIRLAKGGDLIADLGNAAAVLKKRFSFFWVGFYIFVHNKLVLGPFQGTPACVFLEPGKGVCWGCVKAKRTIIVPDVHSFPDHIACDPASRSEIAVPVFDKKGAIRAVLDVDSEFVQTFDKVDQQGLENVAKLLAERWNE